VSRALALAVLTIVASAYMIGWRRLARRSAGTVALWRPLAAAGGLGAFAVATVSPLAEVAHERFTAHMFQHVLMMMIAVPILLIADPFPAVLWSMPRQARGLVGRLLTRAAPLRRYAAAIVAPGIAWALSSTLVWLWHLPTLYDLALENEAWHVVEHFAFVAAAVIFWWPVLAPAPRLRRPPSDGTRLAYLVLSALSTGALGVLFASTTRAIYTAYAGAPDALDDQRLGGVVMWAVGSGVEMTAILAVVWRILARLGPSALTPPGPVREDGLV